MDQSNCQRGSFLFVLWEGGGNIPPQLALARRLAERNHRVRVLAPLVLRERIEAAGCVYLPFVETPEHDSHSRAEDLAKDWEARTNLGGAARFRDRLIFGTALAYSRDVASAIEEERPDVIAADYLVLGAYVAAERAGIPLVGLIHTIYPLPAPGMPPYGMGFQPMSGVPGRMRDAVFAQVFQRFYNAGLKELNQVRVASGLSPLATVFEQFERADRLLVMTSPAFDFPAMLPANVGYVGPQLDDPAWLAPWAPPARSDDHQPLVLVSLSTTYQRQDGVLRRIIAALADMPARGMVTLGPALNRGDFTLPPNVWMEEYAPHTLVCPHADLVVTHAGHGTVMAALSCGAPVACIPMGRDQGDNAARVVWHGAGLRCSSKASMEDLRQAMRRVLKEPTFRENARRIADAIANESGQSNAIEELERLIVSPVSQPIEVAMPRNIA